MLQSTIQPPILEVVKNNLKVFENMEIVFQQDAFPSHFHRPVGDYLYRQYLEGWIARRGLIEWPAKPPDFTPIDCFILEKFPLRNSTQSNY